jgi:hypothetical protein
MYRKNLLRDLYIGYLIINTVKHTQVVNCLAVLKNKTKSIFRCLFISFLGHMNMCWRQHYNEDFCKSSSPPFSFSCLSLNSRLFYRSLHDFVENLTSLWATKKRNFDKRRKSAVLELWKKSNKKKFNGRKLFCIQTVETQTNVHT